MSANDQKSFKSEAQIRRLPAPKTGVAKYKHESTPGLYLHVSPNGSKVFYGLVRDKRRQKATVKQLGHFEKELPLQEARDLVDEARTNSKAMLDPWQHVEERQGDTFAAARERFMRQHVSTLAQNTQNHYRGVLEYDDGRERKRPGRPRTKRLEGWQHLRLTDITRKDVQALIDQIAEESPVQANRALAYLRKFFNWCAEKGLIPENVPTPTARIRPPTKEKPKTRHFDVEELRAFQLALDGIKSPAREILQMLLLTGQRKTEVLNMKWADVDLVEGVWTQKDNKADRLHLVPLSQQAIDIIESMPKPVKDRPYIFSRREKPYDGLKRHKATLEQSLSFAEPWTVHDIRRTVATHMRRLKVDQHTVSRILNHAQQHVTGRVYDQYDSLEEKTSAMQAWALYLQNLVTGGDVVPLSRIDKGANWQSFQ